MIDALEDLIDTALGLLITLGEIYWRLAPYLLTLLLVAHLFGLV